MNEPLLPETQEKLPMVDSKGNLKIGEYIVQTKMPVLGKGSYAVVYQGYKVGKESETLAIKEILMVGRSQDKKFLQNLRREIEILQKLDHVNITCIHDVIYFAEKVFIVLELCGKGNLKEKLEQQSVINEQEVKIYMAQIVHAFKEMYSKNVIHRDLKPANILMVNDYHLKITDFGFARELSQMNTASQLTRVGSPLYMSPQILGGDDFSCKCDIWSLGIIIYQMLTGKAPWVASSPPALLAKIHAKSELRFDDKQIISDALKTLLINMLQVEEEDRIGWEQLFNDDYLRELQKNDAVNSIIEKSIKDSTLQKKDKACPCF